MSRKGKVVQLNLIAQIFVDNPQNDTDAKKKARAIFRQKYNGKAYLLGALVISNKIENV